MADLMAAGLLPDGAAIKALVQGVSNPARVVGGQIELNGSTGSGRCGRVNIP